MVCLSVGVHSDQYYGWLLCLTALLKHLSGTILAVTCLVCDGCMCCRWGAQVLSGSSEQQGRGNEALGSSVSLACMHL